MGPRGALRASRSGVRVGLLGLLALQTQVAPLILVHLGQIFERWAFLRAWEAHMSSTILYLRKRYDKRFRNRSRPPYFRRSNMFTNIWRFLPKLGRCAPNHLSFLLKPMVLECLGYPAFQETHLHPFFNGLVAVFSISFPAPQLQPGGIAMLIYWALLMDFTLLSMRISAFVLVPCPQISAPLVAWLGGCKSIRYHLGICWASQCGMPTLNPDSPGEKMLNASGLRECLGGCVDLFLCFSLPDFDVCDRHQPLGRLNVG